MNQSLSALSSLSLPGSFPGSGPCLSKTLRSKAYTPVQASPATGSLSRMVQGMAPQTAQRQADDFSFGLNALENDVCVLGRISARWPDTQIEREFRCAAQVIQQYPHDIMDYVKGFAPFWPVPVPTTPPPMTAEQAKDDMLSVINTVLSSRYFRYLARELIWLLEDEYGNEIYQLIPSEYNMQQLINALDETQTPPSPDQGGFNPPPQSGTNVNDSTSTINTLVVGSVTPGTGELSQLHIDKFRQVDPATIADQVGYFHQHNQQATMAQLIKSYLLLAKNAGMTDEARALNYLLCYDTGFYSKVYEQRQQSQRQAVHLIGIDARLYYAGERTLVCVIFNYQDQKTSVIEPWSSTIDVTDEYPFMVSEFEPYIHVL
ncbi:hypothetical protein [Vibrio quintilis]|uniref:Uncharacterized protein n=1 Tax=Vibrio quintilis TaxID=1117707 RepID=A0A1M7YVQ8_9VIBR|nr:hypothetical protein [Vibrio quintilis]SHO56643.1 hypothetical protein VQ7734_02412 [Vibrio quintilis]